MNTNRAPRRLSRDESQAQTRERLIEAAQDLIARKGLEGASVRDVAEAAGYSQGAFYSNFARKEDIVIELARRHKAAELEKLDALLAAMRRAPEQAMDLLALACADMSAGADWVLLVQELDLYAGRNPDFAALWNEVSDAFRRSLAKIVAGMFETLGKAPPAPAEDIAAGLMALAHGAALLRGAPGKDAAGSAIMLYIRALLALASAGAAH